MVALFLLYCYSTVVALGVDVLLRLTRFVWRWVWLGGVMCGWRAWVGQSMGGDGLQDGCEVFRHRVFARFGS